MPKPGKYGKPSWKNQYSEHDYRGNDTRRVSFKHNKHLKKKDWGESIRAHLEDEDIDMSVGTTSGSGRSFNRKFKKGGRSGSPIPKKFFDSPVGWYKVTLPHGNKYGKEFILKILQQNVSPLPFWPITWTTQGSYVVFYLDDYKVAKKLFELNRTLQLPDGFKLIINVTNGFPEVNINAELKEKIKQVMATRYNPATKALDLTKFHADPQLQDVFCSLCKPIIFSTVLTIMSENIPDVEAINLFDNKIGTLNFIKNMPLKLNNLKILHIGNNKLVHPTSLDPLIGLPLVELVLNGNPLCARFKDQETYIGEIRKRFPKIVKLDGIDLPPPISFDISEEVRLPPSQQTMLCNPQGESIVRQFLEQYYRIFDSDNRQPLIQAYHEDALFSLTCGYPYRNKDKSSNWLNWYQSESRNLIRITDSDRRQKLLKQGQVSIVSFLQEMPSSKHDIHSFTVDLVVFTPQMITMTVTGLFKEYKSGHKTPPTRYFFRTIVIVPAGSGFCIINDELHVSNATEEQLKAAAKNPAPAPIVSITPATPPQQPHTSTTTPTTEPDDLTKQQMIQALSQQSGMNIEWSGKCLAETHWDFSRATAIFTQLNSQGVIPAEAFV